MTVPPVTHVPNRRSLFRHGAFARLWTAATISLFGTQLSQLAIPFIAAVLLRASPGEVGLLVTIEFLPFLLFTLPAGVWVDRFSRKRILILGDVGRAVVLASIPIAFALDGLTMWQLYVVGFVNGIMTVFFDVADQSYLPSILERDQLVDGNSKLQVSQSSAQILGQPFGGGIIALVSAPIAIAIDAVSFLGSAGLIATIRGDRPHEASDPVTRSASAAATEADDSGRSPAAAASVVVEASAADAAINPEAGAGPPSRGMRADIMDGLRYILRHRFLASVAASTASSNLFSNIAFAVFAVYAYRQLELDPAEVGLLGGIGGAGVMIGALLSGRIAAALGIGPTIVGSLALGSVSGLLVPLAPKESAFLFLAGAFFFASIFNVVYNINQVSLRQAITPEAFLGRMNATMRFLVWGTIPIGSLIGAGLSEVVGVHTTVWIGALLGLLGFVPVLLSPVRGLRTIPDVEPDTEAAAA